jgi:hypothetical protein
MTYIEFLLCFSHLSADEVMTVRILLVLKTLAEPIDVLLGRVDLELESIF